MTQKILFIDRDGTLIAEPADAQIDSIAKFALLPDVVPALLQLKAAGYCFVMITNQDGLGTSGYPQESFDLIQKLLLEILSSQGIVFDSIRICPHFAKDKCDCRKPKVQLVMDYLIEQKINRAESYVIGDRVTDLEFAKNLGIQGLRLGDADTPDWNAIVQKIIWKPREVLVQRKTNETEIAVRVNVDTPSPVRINTGLGFFDHMLEQLAKHGGFSLDLQVQGDWNIDEHHSIEDTALALGEALNQALADRRGIGRYGFVLPMDEAQVQVALDLSGRPYCRFEAEFKRECVGELPTELISHFFQSLAQALRATMHIRVTGENAHHMVEAVFKGVGRTLRQAMICSGMEIPSTKGAL